jgi:DNA-binding CsgD family transcriptional regulator
LKTDLSDRELAVLTFAAQGYTDDMVAQELGIQCGTVNSYWVRIRGKLGNLSRSELVARFVQKNADTAHADYVSQNGVDAATLADENQVILAKANAEIEHLKKLLKKARSQG